MIRETFSRRFQVWDYHVSHSQLLIRSPKIKDDPVNIDIVFLGVDYMSLPSHFGPDPGLDIQEGDVSDLEALRELASVDSGRVFWLNSNGRRYVVIASGCEISRTEHEMFESSLHRTFLPSKFRAGP